MKCPDCGADMVQMIFSSFCPNDCDKKAEVGVSSAPTTSSSEERNWYYMSVGSYDFAMVKDGVALKDVRAFNKPFITASGNSLVKVRFEEDKVIRYLTSVLVIEGAKVLEMVPCP